MSEESRMKKTIIRIAVCVVVFLASALIIGSIMNQGHNNMTMEMAPATLPMITMESGGVACNELHGNTVEMDVAYQKDCITLLGEGTGEFHRGYVRKRNYGDLDRGSQHRRQPADREQ